MMAFTQVVETSVANCSPSQDSDQGVFLLGSNHFLNNNFVFAISCLSFEHILCSSVKAFKITDMRGENKHGDPIFLLPFLNVLSMAINYAKLEKKSG